MWTVDGRCALISLYLILFICGDIIGIRIGKSGKHHCSVC